MSIWLGKDPLILASQSGARQMLLANAGIAFEAIPADIDEREIQKNSGLTAPGEIAKLLAREKALWVSQRHPGRIVVGQRGPMGSFTCLQNTGASVEAPQWRWRCQSDGTRPAGPGVGWLSGWCSGAANAGPS